MWKAIDTLPAGGPWPLLAWHRYNGAALIFGGRTAYATHWDDLPGADDWRRTADGLPGREDADAQGCVLAYSELSGYQVVRWDLIGMDRMYTRWTRLPGKPGAGTEETK